MASRVVGVAQVLDQSFQPSPVGQWISVGTSTNFALAQTFTVGVAGALTRFNAYIVDAGHAGGGFPVLWDIRPTIGGAPVQSDTASLASGTFLSSVAPNWGFYSVDLGSSPIFVEPGEVLAIVFRTAPGYDGVSISWLGERPNLYTGGAAYVGNPRENGSAWSTSLLTDYDLGFQTYVVPVPEPSSAFLLFVGVCAILGIRRLTLASANAPGCASVAIRRSLAAHR